MFVTQRTRLEPRMPDHIFSAARLRGYRILEAADLGNADDLAIQDTLIGSHLWLPVSLIEIAFRNLVDRAISSSHSEGPGWLFATGGAADTLMAAEVTGPAWLQSKREDGSVEDPIRIAARMSAAQTQRAEITRDDLVAHLMLGFWVVRVPEALKAQIEVFDVVASGLPAPIDSGDRLRRMMVDDVLRIRNRVAHHEPLLFRRKHMVAKRSGDQKSGADLVTSLQGAITAFQEDAREVIEVAKSMVPTAGIHLDRVLKQLDADVKPFADRLAAQRERLRVERETRRNERRSP